MEVEVDNREGDLFLFYKSNLSMRFKRALNLNEAESSFNAQQNIHAFTYLGEGGRLLTVSSGVMHPSARITVRIAKRMARHFPQRRVFFVCLASQKARLEQYVPAAWRFCVRVEDVAAALNVQFTDEQDMQLRRFMPYDGPRDGPFRVHRAQEEDEENGGGNVAFMINMGLLARALQGGPVLDDLQAALEASQRAYEEQQQRNQVNVREQERGKHPWDPLFSETIPIGEDEEEQEDCGGACVACQENYASIRFMDAAGECDHISLCDNCARIIMDTTRKCPLCRAVAVTIRRKRPKEEEEEEEEEEGEDKEVLSSERKRAKV